MTYRARLEGTSERGSDSLISLIEDWVRGGPGVIVTGVLMTVDSHCSVAISSLSEGECLPHDTSTEPRATKYGSSQGSTNNTGGIIGGTFAIVLIIVVALTIIAIAAILMNRQAGEKLVESSTLSLSLALSLSNPPTHPPTHTHHTHTHTHMLSLTH